MELSIKRINTQGLVYIEPLDEAPSGIGEAIIQAATFMKLKSFSNTVIP